MRSTCLKSQCFSEEGGQRPLTNPPYEPSGPTRFGFPKPRKTYHHISSTGNWRRYSYWPECNVLIGVTYPILKDALLQPTFSSVFWFLPLLLFRPVDSAATITWSKKARRVGEWKDQPDEPDNDEIYVLQIICDPKPALPLHHALNVVGIGLPECSELLP